MGWGRVLLPVACASSRVAVFSADVQQSRLADLDRSFLGCELVVTVEWFTRSEIYLEASGCWEPEPGLFDNQRR